MALRRADGHQDWYVRYQAGPRGKRTWRWFRVGDARAVSLAKATKVAPTTLTEVQVEERDPHAERKQRRTESLTFADLFKEWHERHAEPKLARAELDMSIYQHHLEDDFARQVVAEIKRLEIGRLRDKLAKESGTAGSDNLL